MKNTSTQIFLPVIRISQRTRKSICLNEVIMLRGEVNYTIFCLKNGKTIMIAHTLKYFEELLNGHGFLRVHRAYLVNPKHILNYDEVGHTIEMGCNLVAHVSRRRAKDLNMNWTS